MGLKRRNKTSAEFSMASLTDIIFLLLIFFMPTSNFVGIPGMDLPESDSKTVAPHTFTVTIAKDGAYTFNSKTISSKRIETSIRRAKAALEPKDVKSATLTIAAEQGVPFGKVTDLMEIAAKLRLRAIIATKPKG